MTELIAPPGLKGLVVADTQVGSVRGDEGFFHYRQHDAVAVARHHSLEAAAALLIDGTLPGARAEEEFRAELGAARSLDPATLAVVEPVAALVDSPLAGLAAIIPLLVDDTPTIDLAPDQRRARALRVAAAVPTVLAAAHRIRAGLEPMAADPDRGHAVDYLRMVTGRAPSPQVARAVESYLLVTADHGFNASTFTTRVVTSTGAGVASILASAVAALSGPLHGGAPSRVLDMIDDIGDPANTEAWAQQRLDRGQTIMGFGHAVYRVEDPRGVLLKEVALGLGGEVVARAEEIESRMLRLLARWKPEANLVTNVEYYAAIVLHLAGLPQSMFTPSFVTSRVMGWVAHLLEQAAANKIMRPRARYVGPEPRRGALAS